MQINLFSLATYFVENSKFRLMDKAIKEEYKVMGNITCEGDHKSIPADEFEILKKHLPWIMDHSEKWLDDKIKAERFILSLVDVSMFERKNKIINFLDEMK